MIEMFLMGGMLFMTLVTLPFIGSIVLAVRSALLIFSDKPADDAMFRTLGYIKSTGLLSFVLGILGQLIGLYSAFEAIEQMGSVSPAMLAGGLKVSSITSIWGMICLALSMIMYLGLSFFAKKKD